MINTNRDRSLAVSNRGNSPLTVTALAFSGTGSTVFKLPGLTMPFTVAPGRTTNLTVTFTPTAAVSNQAKLTASVPGLTGGTNWIFVTGTGIPIARPLASPQTADRVAACSTTGGGALVVCVIDLTLPPDMPENGELAEVLLAGGQAQVAPMPLAAGGATVNIALTCCGADENRDGIPDAVAATLGDRLTEGAKLLTLHYVNGTITATTPFADALVVEGIPLPPDALPATWRLTPAGGRQE